MTLELTVLVLQLLATGFMTGLIWFVQVVHYPLFAAVDQGSFTRYERRHMERTGLVVGPPMIVEAACAVWLARTGAPVAILGLALLVAVWISTWARQVPLHRRLSERADPDAIRALVTSNWIRTIAWTARLPLALVMLLEGAAP